MSNRVLLCVDLSNQVYKASAVHSNLTSNGRFTGGLFGLLTSLAKAILYTQATEVVICRDSKPYIRSLDYPEYKALRKETRDEELKIRAAETMTYMDELVHAIGTPVWEISGFEFDDLVAHVAGKYRHRYSKIVAMSNDSDLYQLFQYKGFSMWKGKDAEYTMEHYLKEWKDLDPSKIPLLLALTGTHNEIEGIARVGPATALAALRDPVKLRSYRAEHGELIDRNLDLITLPHPKFPRDAVIPKRTVEFKDRRLLIFCGKYDISTTKAMLDAFTQIGSTN